MEGPVGTDQEGVMDEYVRRQYLREEGFLEEYLGTVDAVLPQLPCPWQPNFQCNDQARWQRDRLLATGQLESLTSTVLSSSTAAPASPRSDFNWLGRARVEMCPKL